MRQGIQTGFKHGELRSHGCYFFTLCAWAHLAFEKIFSDDDIIAAYEHCLKQGWIFTGRDEKGKQWTCLIKNPVQIFNYLAERPGYFKGAEHSNAVPGTVRFPVFFEKTTPNGFDHFALGQVADGKVKIVFDSWSPPAESRGLKITNYRAFK